MSDADQHEQECWDEFWKAAAHVLANIERRRRTPCTETRTSPARSRHLPEVAMNHTLHQALAKAGLDESAIAEHLNVDRKTVKRWIAGRTPYSRYRSALADLLNLDESVLWLQAKPLGQLADESHAEIQAVYAHRWAVPRDEWQNLFESAEHEIGILAYAALFLAEDNGILRILANKARAGVKVRILLGNPDSACIAERGADEGIDDAISAKIRNALVLYKPLTEIDGIEIRLHETTLYASIYRADDDLLINIHAYGATASQAPVLHLSHTQNNDMAATYLRSFDDVWHLSERAPYQPKPK